jgi:hypothetical protein
MVGQQVPFEMGAIFWQTALCHPRRQQYANVSVWLLLAIFSVLAAV